VCAQLSMERKINPDLACVRPAARVREVLEFGHKLPRNETEKFSPTKLVDKRQDWLGKQVKGMIV
jgi:hypothetical protein